MGSKTNIEWCDSTVNPTTGCDGCELWAGDVRACYAGNLHESRLALTLPQLYAENFTDVRLAPGRMAAAAGWSDLRGKSRHGKPALDGLPRMIFVGDMGDIFSKDVPFEYLRDEVMAAATSSKGQRHVWLWLTKQSQRMVAFAEWLDREGDLWPENVWTGVSVTAQVSLSRVSNLLRVPRAERLFVSAEPLLGPVDLDSVWPGGMPHPGYGSVLPWDRLGDCRG
jgi:protein gp37